MKGSRTGIMKLPRLAARTALAAGLAAGLAACGQVPAAGGQPGAPRPSAGSAQATTAVPAVTITPAGSGSASAGTGSAAPAITVSGPVTTTGPKPTVTPPSATGSVTLTAADNGQVVNVRVGQTVTVALAPDFMAWHLPAAAGAALRRVSASGGYPSRQPARAVFLAVAPGTAVLSAESDMACLHAHPRCMVPQQLWHVTVRVSGA
jgi:hypothetical protein